MELVAVVAALAAGFVLGWSARFRYQVRRAREWIHKDPERWRRTLDALRRANDV